MPKIPTVKAEDLGFLGVNNRLDPSQLEPGLGADAVNERFTHGVAGGRKGIRKLNWTNRIIGRAIQPYKIIWGAGKFRDPNGAEWDVVAADGQVYLCREHEPPALSLKLPAGVTIDRPVTFTQAFNELILFRGEALPELRLQQIETGFEAITKQPNTVLGPGTENLIDGAEAIPNATRGLFFQNRVFIPYGKDLVGVSDYLNYTRYSPVRSVFRINQGSSDALVTLGRFNETTLIAFKEQSIYAIGNIAGDLTGATLYEITSEYGCKAAKSVVAVGKDLWFLADKRGVCSITLTEQNKIQGVDVPVSQDIEKTVGRINWRYADQAAGAYWANRFYLAVPLDAAEVVKRNLLAPGLTYNSAGERVQPVIAGRKYRWTKGTDLGVAVPGAVIAVWWGDYPGGYPVPVTPGKTYHWYVGPGSTSFTLTNGGSTYHPGSAPVTFVATGATVLLRGRAGIDGFFNDRIDEVVLSNNADISATGDSLLLLGAANAALTATLRPLFVGVNNAVLVYDFLNQKWSGHDESVVLQVKDWSLATVQGRQRLIFFSHDGFLNLYEEGDYDEDILTERPLATEVRVKEPPANGWLLALSGSNGVAGTNIVASLANANAGQNWGTGNPASAAIARGNFWTGYNGAWPKPGLEITRMTPSAVRFRAADGDGHATVSLPGGGDPGVLIEDVANIYFEPVISTFVSRGYLCDTLKPKSFLRLAVAWASSNPNVSIDLITEGANEIVNVIANRTRNRLAYYRPHDQPDWVADNRNGDYLTPYREDYAWVLGPTDSIYLDAKIDPELMQEIEEKFSAKGRGKYAQVRVTNNQGRLELKSLSVEAVLASERFGVQA